MEKELNNKISDLMEVDTSVLVNNKILDEIEAWGFGNYARISSCFK